MSVKTSLNTDAQNLPEAIDELHAKLTNKFKLYGQTSTTTLGSDSDTLAFTLGGTDYPELDFETRKSWDVKITAQTIGSSSVGVFKRWQGDFSFIVGGTGQNKFVFGELIPVTGSSVNSTVTIENPSVSISGASAPYEIHVFVEHENITTANVVDIEWTLEVTELAGVAKGWS